MLILQAAPPKGCRNYNVVVGLKLILNYKKQHINKTTTLQKQQQSDNTRGLIGNTQPPTPIRSLYKLHSWISFATQSTQWVIRANIHTDSPISFKLEKPAVIGMCFGDFPRLGALEDQVLHPSPRDFNLKEEKRIIFLIIRKLLMHNASNGNEYYKNLLFTPQSHHSFYRDNLASTSYLSGRLHLNRCVCNVKSKSQWNLN